LPLLLLLLLLMLTLTFRLVAKVNLSHTVGDLRHYVNA
jgi:hypothetical protein